MTALLLLAFALALALCGYPARKALTDGFVSALDLLGAVAGAITQASSRSERWSCCATP